MNKIVKKIIGWSIAGVLSIGLFTAMTLCIGIIWATIVLFGAIGLAGLILLAICLIIDNE